MDDLIEKKNAGELLDEVRRRYSEKKYLEDFLNESVVQFRKKSIKKTYKRRSKFCLVLSFWLTL